MIQKRKGAEGVRFVVYHNSGGKRRYVGTYDSERQAEEAEQDFAVVRRKIDRGQLPEGMELRRRFGDASDAWLKSLATRKSRSHETYERRTENYLSPAFAETPLADISQAQMMDLRDRLALKLAAPTVNGIMACASAAFTYFVKRQWLAVNPCHGLERVESPETAFNWLHTKGDINRLLVACNGELREAVAITLATGLRIDELLHLQHDDIDIARRIITVHRGRQGTVKSGRLRQVPILDAILPLMREKALRRGGETLLFPGRRGKPRYGDVLRDSLKRAMKRAGLEFHLRWHDLRHTFASHWMIDGGDIFKLSRILGHANMKQTMRYSHLAPQAFEGDYGRLAFQLPAPPATVIDLRAARSST